MDPDEQTHAAESEAIFRDVNEMVVGSEPVAESLTILCECADEFCAESVTLTRVEYEQVRAVADHFAVVPGHVLPEIERIVEERPQYWVIEKLGRAGEVAQETDPRTDD